MTLLVNGRRNSYRQETTKFLIPIFGFQFFNKITQWQKIPIDSKNKFNIIQLETKWIGCNLTHGWFSEWSINDAKLENNSTLFCLSDRNHSLHVWSFQFLNANNLSIKVTSRIFCFHFLGVRSPKRFRIKVNKSWVYEWVTNV